MPLSIYNTATATHRQALHSPLTLGSAAVVFCFHGGDQLLEEEIFISVTWHVEVSVLHIMHIGISCTGHYNHHCSSLTTCNEFVGHSRQTTH